jgi:hypothetical protein
LKLLIILSLNLCFVSQEQWVTRVCTRTQKLHTQVLPTTVPCCPLMWSCSQNSGPMMSGVTERTQANTRRAWQNPLAL